MTDEQLRHLFGFVPPTPTQEQAIVRLRTSFYGLAQQVVAGSSPGRDRDLALTALQKASWACIAAAVSGRKE